MTQSAPPAPVHGIQVAPHASGTRRGFWAIAALPLVLYLLDRALLFALGAAAPHILAPPRRHANHDFLPASDLLNHLGALARPWFRFDARWYAGVVAHGYHWGTVATTNTNFLPLFPLVARALEPITAGSPWAATWIVANLSYAVALVLLWIWIRSHWSDARALPALLLNIVFPFAFFTAAPYAEPLFLALSVATFLLLERDKPHAALLCAAAATVCRPVGVALVAALAVYHLTHGDRREAALSLLGVLPLAMFALYLGVDFGHPLGFTVYHTYGWVPPHGGIISTIGSQFNTPLTPFDRVDAAMAVVFLVSGVFVWRRLGPAYGLFVLMSTLLPLTKGLAGMERYVSVLFPVMAIWGAGLGKAWSMLLFAVSLLGLVLFTILFAAGYSIF
jgi:hypothetical protein